VVTIPLPRKADNSFLDGGAQRCLAGVGRPAIVQRESP
jgi:hypothetical protein